MEFFVHLLRRSLNPYCNGRKNRMRNNEMETKKIPAALILIVMEERIGSTMSRQTRKPSSNVLILIVMEERIGFINVSTTSILGLNPYCNGRKNRI